MASNTSIQSAQSDFVNGSVPRSIAIYTVPDGYDFVLLAATVITTSITGSGAPTITLGNTDDPAAYQNEVQGAAFLDLPVNPSLPQTTVIPTGVMIQATIIANSTATAQTGSISISGYLVSLSGDDFNPTPPINSDVIGYLYTLDAGGNTLPSVSINYQLVATATGTGSASDIAPQTVTSDANGLAQFPVDPGSTYQLWSGCQSPITVTIPADAISSYALPDITFVI